MKILIATDAWSPQVNGVVTALVNTTRWLRLAGHVVHVVSPEGLRTMPTPSYPEIPLALFPGREVARRIRDFAPDALHVATEGPIGAAARAFCIRHALPFTTRAELEQGADNVAAARAAIYEAQQLAERAGAGPESELGRLLAKVRQAITPGRTS